MALSSDLIAKFAKVVKNSKPKDKKENFAYGTIVLDSEGKMCVKLDGSDVFTPISSTTDLLPGDRAMVLIKNHTVTVTGNMSSPAARTSDLKSLASSISAQSIINLIYPVGSIYMSTTEVSPEVIFGGKWEQIKDTFLLACGDGYANGNTGGEESHTLTVEEMPAHSHEPTDKTVDSDTYNTYGYQLIRHLSSESTGRYMMAAGSDYYAFSMNPNASDYVSKNDLIVSYTSATTGGSQSHNNMPPYLAVYIWKRIG